MPLPPIHSRRSSRLLSHASTLSVAAVVGILIGTHLAQRGGDEAPRESSDQGHYGVRQGLTVPPLIYGDDDTQTLHRMIEVRNNTPEPVTFRDWRASCGCSRGTLHPVGEPVAPGAAVSLDLEISLAGLDGEKAISVVLETDDRPWLVVMTVRAHPRLTFSPKALYLDDVSVGEAPTANWSIVYHDEDAEAESPEFEVTPGVSAGAGGRRESDDWERFGARGNRGHSPDYTSVPNRFTGGGIEWSIPTAIPC